MKQTTRRLAAALWVTLALTGLAGTTRAQAPGAADPAARSAFEAGRDAYDRGRFGEALLQFERAYELSRAPKLLFNIGRAAESDGRYQRAIEVYEAYLQNVPQAENREFVEARIAKLRASTSAATPAPAPRSEAAPPAATGLPASTESPAVPEQAAEGVPGRLRFHGGLGLGAGGKLKSDATYDSPSEYYTGSVENELRATWGFQLGGGYAWEYLSLAGELRFAWISLEPVEVDGETLDSERELLIDIAIKPAARYFISKLDLELYGAVPVGMTIPRLDDGDSKIGVNVGALLGATYYFTQQLGANVETGLLWRKFSVEGSGESVVGDPDATLKSSMTMTQFVLAANLVFAI